MKTTISVIIPALNEAECIECTIKSAWEAGMDEVIVVDGQSEDATVDIARRNGAQVFSSPCGRAIQQNLGAKNTDGEVLLFLHADNWLAPTVGKQIRNCLHDENNMGGAFRQQIEAPGRLYRLLERGNAARVRLRGLPYGDQAIFMRKTIFDRLGGFPQVKLMEDVLIMRAFRRISKPVLLPGPVHVHPRRWQQNGVVWQTLRNWSLICAQAVGVSLDRLAKFYPSHNGRKKILHTNVTKHSGE
jgi:rSAM/selenodomain-associated transferase 2